MHDASLGSLNARDSVQSWTRGKKKGLERGMQSDAVMRKLVGGRV